MATIKAIEDRTVHQIQSGQVIIDLCSVVKELVENSLDAGATSVDVRFKNQGLESIEVQDNGDGISPHNYETLALKHHTSKLSTYSDLTTLQTFGFRGEALSSLCALSQFSVTTCMAKDAPKGTKLEFEVSGKLKGTSVVAAQKGTTVTVEKLFNNLPVRRRELERNIKREWGKVIGVLGQYACIQTGVKFSVSQQAGKGKKTSLFSTKGNKTTRENIVNVFGAKTLAALVPMDLRLELEPTSGPSQRWSTQDDGGQKEIRIVGHISRPASGEGRQTPDRQMFFVNARPCGLPQVAKAFNEVYKAYNGSQSPFIFANIELDTHLYDVNVSPDKRTIMLHDQTRMLDNLKEALTALFDSQNYTVPISQLPAQKQTSYKQLTIKREASTFSNTASVKRARSTSPCEASLVKRARSLSEEDDAEHVPNGQRPGGDSSDDASSSRAAMRNGQSNAPRTSISLAGNGVSLISNWAGRNATERREPGVSNTKVDKVVDKKARDDARLREMLGPEDEDESHDGRVENPTQSSTLPATYHPPIPVADFNARLTELHGENDTSRNPETTIPALKTPSKPPSSLSSLFSSTSKSRPSNEIATIIIGGDTTTSIVGTPAPKSVQLGVVRCTSRNSRLHTPKGGPKAPLLSFGSKLSQRYGATGTTQAAESDKEEYNDDKNEAPNSSSPSTSHAHDGFAGSRFGTSKAAVQQRDPSPVQNPTEADADGSSTQVVVEQDTEDNMEVDLQPSDPEEAEEDDEYIDEDEKKAREDAKVQQMIKVAEEAAAQPSQSNVLRAKSLLKGGSRKKDSTLNLVKSVKTSISDINDQISQLDNVLSTDDQLPAPTTKESPLDSSLAEEKLSLTISKPDFAKMKIVGQFNLGFILATRTSSTLPEENKPRADDLFIIDQHASDEKYNFERLQSTTTVQSQRLVHPKLLDLTALEEEIVLENLKVLESNGFIVTFDHTGTSPVGQRCQLISLPISRETTFSIEDLEELIALLMDHPSGGSIPRPSKVRKMFAMRACRSSIMIGKGLSQKQMGNVVRHMGEIDKPWNCPHGRPTMRHLCGLGVWDEVGWREVGDDRRTDWAGFTRGAKKGDEDMDEDEDEETSTKGDHVDDEEDISDENKEILEEEIY